MEKFKFFKELIKALCAIRNAINGEEGGNEGGDNQQSNLSWYDALKQIYGIPPVAIYDGNNNDDIRFLKDISFSERLPFESGIVLYDDNTLFSYKYNGIAYSPIREFGYITSATENNKEFEDLTFGTIYKNSGGSVGEFEEVDGKMLYEYYYRNADK